MRILKNYTENEILAIIENVVNRLARKFRFGYWDVDDLKQEGRMEAIKAIEKEGYDEKRPLENFLYTAVRNHYINLQRNKYTRRELPCKSCPFYDPNNLKSTNSCAAFLDKMECDKWAAWELRNASKRNIMSPIDIGAVRDEDEDNMRDDSVVDDDVAYKEMMSLIDQKLPVALRADYIRLKSKEPIPKYRADKVREAIMEIIKYDADDTA